MFRNSDFEAELLGSRFYIKLPHELRGNPRLAYVYKDAYDPSLAILPFLITPKMNVLDVGAHYGVYSVILSQLCHEGGLVFAYEPVPEFCQQIQKNIDFYSLDNIEIRQLAVSNSMGQATFVLERDKSRTSVKILSGARNSDLITVDVVTLDSEKSSLPKISFVKIDAEGFDANVIEGMTKLLLESRPIIQCEILDLQTRQQIEKLFVTINYSLYSLANFCKLRGIPEPQQSHSSGNYYGVPTQSD